MNPLDDLIRQLDLEPPRPVHPRRSGRVAAMGVVLSLLVVGVWLGSAVRGPRPSSTEASLDAPAGPTVTADGDATDTGIAAYRGPGWIAAENARPGTTDWTIPDSPTTWDKIRGFADATSVDHGGSVRLFVTTAAPTWKVDAYRFGYYGGTGGRLVWSSDTQPGKVQADPVVDKATHMAEAHWDPSLTVATGPDWPPGQYLLKLTSSDGGATFVPLVVRDDGSDAALLVQSSVTTWQAYNTWGWGSLYAGPRGDSTTRSRVVSFDRPYGGNGSGEFFGREFEFIYDAERLGLDLTYWTDVDLHQRGDLARRHRAVISLGHDEYYSTAMRAGLEQARDAGVNLAFLGANAVFRKIRLEDSPLGANRREVNYRVAAEDPLNGKQPSEVTVSWREAPSRAPESALVGNYYECNPVKADMVIVDSGAWMFDGSGLHDGDKLPGVVGNEYDRVTPEVPTPGNIQVLAHSPVTCRGKPSFADATYYTADSGAGVFAVGTFLWIPALKSDCPEGATPTQPDCQIQKVVENLLRDFSLGPAGQRHPSTNNLARFGIRPGYTSSIEPPSQDSSQTSTTTSAASAQSTTTTRPGSSTTSTKVPAPSSTTTAPPVSSTAPSTTAPDTPAP